MIRRLLPLLVCLLVACAADPPEKSETKQALDESTEVGAYYADVIEAMCLRYASCCEVGVYGPGQSFDVAQCKTLHSSANTVAGTLAFATSHPAATVSEVGRDACLAGIATAACGSVESEDWAPLLEACRQAIEVPTPSVVGGTPCSNPGGEDTCGTLRGTGLRCNGTQCVPRAELGDECVESWDCESEICDWGPTPSGIPTVCASSIVIFADEYTCNFYAE